MLNGDTTHHDANSAFSRSSAGFDSDEDAEPTRPHDGDTGYVTQPTIITSAITTTPAAPVADDLDQAATDVVVKTVVAVGTTETPSERESKRKGLRLRLPGMKKNKKSPAGSREEAEENKRHGHHSDSSGGDGHHHPNGEPGKAERPLTRSQRDEQELKQIFSAHVFRISFFLWCQGLINNFHYNLVISGANSLAASFSMTQYVALISFMNVFFGIIARIVNAFVAHRVSYNIRMTLMSIGTIIGLLVVSFSGDIGGSNDAACFVVLLIGVAFTGTSYSYGETVVLSFMQRYPPNIVGAWGSGTGISGVITSLLFIGLNSAGLSLKVIYLITLPLAVIYWFVFCFGLIAPHKVVTVTYVDGSKPPHQIVLHRGFERKKMAELEAMKPDIEISDYSYKMIMNFTGLSWESIPPPATVYGHVPGGNVVHDEDDAYAPQTDAMADVVHENRPDYKPDDLYYPCCHVLCGCCSRTSGPRHWWGKNGYVIGLLHNKMFWFYFNLSVVYIAEYAAQFMAPFSFYCKISWAGNFWITNSYTITQFCYQLGVFISRSSLMCIKIPYVGVISIIQVINAVGWLVQAKTKFISIHSSEGAEVGLSFLLYIWMLFVGLLGGASYVNVFYLILCRGQAMQQAEEDAAILDYLQRRGGTDLQPEGEEDQNRSSAHAAEKSRHSTNDVVGEVEKMRSSTGSSTAAVRVTATDSVPITHIPPTAAAAAPTPTSKGKSKAVEGRLTHSDSEEEATDFDEVPVPEVDPTLLRIGMPNRVLTDAEVDEVEHIRNTSGEEWQRRRELAMSMGSLYAMVGICIGTMLDVIFTNTILSTKSTCVEG